MNFLSSEILDPVFANNKFVLIQSIHDKMKDFLLDLDLSKEINFEAALGFIEKNIQKYNFKVTLNKLKNAMLDEKNSLGILLVESSKEQRKSSEVEAMNGPSQNLGRNSNPSPPV